MNELTPADIKVVAAIGDSLTVSIFMHALQTARAFPLFSPPRIQAAMGAKACTVLTDLVGVQGRVLEVRGVIERHANIVTCDVTSIGGDGDVSSTGTMPSEPHVYSHAYHLSHFHHPPIPTHPPPDIIKEYNPNVVGYAIKTGSETSANANLDQAVSGAIARLINQHDYCKHVG